MALFYKPFEVFRIALLSCFLFVVLAASAQAQIGNAVFTVEDIKVDVTASNAIEARKQAFERAQQEAFKALSARMLDAGSVAALEPLPVSTISMLIQDYEVTKEQLSSVRYIGTYTFRFRERAVKQYFANIGQSYTDVSSRPVLILPYFEQDGAASLWSPYNRWMETWMNASDLGGLVPVAVPLGDLQDVRDIGEGDSLAYKARNLRAMLERYGAREAVIAMAAADENVGTLTINLYRTDRAQPEYVTQIIQPAQDGQKFDELYDLALVRVHTFLQQDWKAKTIVSAQNSNHLSVRVPFKSLGEWTQTRRALQRVQGISDIDVKSLSPTAAKIDLAFQGTEQRLRLALDQAGITLSHPRFSTIGLNPEYGQQTGAPGVYELYLDRYAPGRPSY